MKNTWGAREGCSLTNLRVCDREVKESVGTLSGDKVTGGQHFLILLYLTSFALVGVIFGTVIPSC